MGKAHALLTRERVEPGGRYLAVRTQHIGPGAMRGMAQTQRKVRRRIDCFPANEHGEKQMHPIGHAGVSDHAKLLTAADDALPFSNRRCDHAEMAVDAYEAGMLHQDL